MFPNRVFPTNQVLALLSVCLSFLSAQSSFQDSATIRMWQEGASNTGGKRQGQNVYSIAEITKGADGGASVQEERDGL